MQPAARSGYTADQVTSLIRDSGVLTVDKGLELLDINLNVQADLSPWLVDGEVSRDSYATLHGTAKFSLSQELDWGTAIVRPYLLLSGSGLTSVRFNLGAYLTDVPATDLLENPLTHEIDGFDILDWLNQGVGEAYSVAAGTDVLAQVETILLNLGITQYQIDQTSTGTLLPSARVYALSDNMTWLQIINDLLGAIGYLGIFSDWDGRLRVEQYLLPSTRSSEWFYDSAQATTMLAPKRTVSRDFYRAPNRWVFFWSQDPTGAAPVEGAGVYTYTNDTNGPTSIAARGRTISAAPVQLNVVDQASLVAAAQQRIDSDMQLKTTIAVGTSPNPLHWHFDRLTLDDPGVGPTAQCLVMSWTLPLSGGDMTQKWAVL